MLCMYMCGMAQLHACMHVHVWNGTASYIIYSTNLNDCGWSELESSPPSPARVSLNGIIFPGILRLWFSKGPGW